MILGFKPQFKEPILNGTKIHTIREDKNNRWKPGNTIQMATGVRTKNYNCFAKADCVYVQDIEIKWVKDKITQSRGVIVYIDDVNITQTDLIDDLVKNDGFESRRDFFEWFKNDFKGKIIHWTYFKYEL